MRSSPGAGWQASSPPPPQQQALAPAAAGALRYRAWQESGACPGVPAACPTVQHVHFIQRSPTDRSACHSESFLAARLALEDLRLQQCAAACPAQLLKSSSSATKARHHLQCSTTQGCVLSHTLPCQPLQTSLMAGPSLDLPPQLPCLACNQLVLPQAAAPSQPVVQSVHIT